WISFFDDISYSVNINQFISKCYLMVIPNPDHIYFQTTLHLKLFDSLACGRPVVSTNCKETAKILNSHHCGLVSDFTEQDFAEKITQLLMNRKEASVMGRNGRRIVEDIYNWDNMARKIIQYTS
ncbi:MAG: glycosyltransferase, partial [Candidatus Scalindua sp.]|nr:glycosyltransferase [Candidatus Scalindua sp.]